MLCCKYTIFHAVYSCSSHKLNHAGSIYQVLIEEEWNILSIHFQLPHDL